MTNKIEITQADRAVYSSILRAMGATRSANFALRGECDDAEPLRILAQYRLTQTNFRDAEIALAHEPFWLVWSPDGKTPPKYRHYNQILAGTEAERLAAAHPEKTFYVLAAESSVKHSIKYTSFRSEEGPF